MLHVLLLCAALAADWPGEPDAASAAWSHTDTGVAWRDLAVGTAPLAEPGSRVLVHYTGRLADGSVFDASRDRGQPFSFAIGQHQVIRGWEDGLVGAGPGTTRRLVIPPDQGYGDRPAGPIPPGSTLYFEVEVLEVSAPRKAPAAPQPVDPEAWRRGRDDLGWVDLALGDGAKPTPGERVCVDFTAWSQGLPVEHTYALERCRWFRYEPGKVVDGLYEGLRTMREGGSRQLRVPPGLAGAPHRPDGVPADEVLLYEVHLIEAKPRAR